MYQRLKHCFLKFFSQSALKTLFFFALLGKLVFSEIKNINFESVVKSPEISGLRKKMDFLNEKINSLSKQKNNYKVQDVKKTDPPESVFTNQYSANKISYIYGDKRGSLPNLSELQKVYINQFGQLL